MKTSFLKLLCLTTLLVALSLSSPLQAQRTVQLDSPGLPVADEATDGTGNVIIFSNLGQTELGKFATAPSEGVAIAGKKALPDVETWNAVSFVPKSDVQAKELSAAIEYLSGTRLVNLGIYTNDDLTGSVGTLIPGGQGSTTQIPDSGSCCEMAKVTLPGAGVSLKANTQYWLVASPDDVNGADFDGHWQLTTKATYAQGAYSAWGNHLGPWPAAQIAGTKKGNTTDKQSQKLLKDTSGTRANFIIFNNLGPKRFYALYDAGAGLYVSGKDGKDVSDVWRAIPFTASANCHATDLAAAIGYVSGTAKVNLGIYSDNAGTVGSLLPGGQGSSTKIPASDACCDLVKVKLAGEGLALTAGVQYWLVASPDDISAPTFEGIWRTTYRAGGAYQEPRTVINWTYYSGYWLAARIEGTVP